MVFVDHFGDKGGKIVAKLNDIFVADNEAHQLWKVPAVPKVLNRMLPPWANAGLVVVMKDREELKVFKSRTEWIHEAEHRVASLCFEPHDVKLFKS